MGVLYREGGRCCVCVCVQTENNYVCVCMCARCKNNCVHVCAFLCCMCVQWGQGWIKLGNSGTERRAPPGIIEEQRDDLTGQMEECNNGQVEKRNDKRGEGRRVGVWRGETELASRAERYTITDPHTRSLCIFTIPSTVL